MDVRPTAATAGIPLAHHLPAAEPPAPVDPVARVVRLPKTASGGVDLEQVLALGGQVRGVLPPRPEPAPGADVDSVRNAYFVAEVALTPDEPFVRVQGFSLL